MKVILSEYFDFYDIQIQLLWTLRYNYMHQILQVAFVLITVTSIIFFSLMHYSYNIIRDTVLYPECWTDYIIIFISAAVLECPL